MERQHNRSLNYLYTYKFHEDEEALCRLEQRALFGRDLTGHAILSPRLLDPSRSPFVKCRMDIELEADSVDALANQAGSIELYGSSYKVVFAGEDRQTEYDEQLRIVRRIGSRIRGAFDMRNPQLVYGVAKADGMWRLGICRANEAVWLRHKDKPRQYSTALGTRMARAIVNIAVPDPERAARVIDPCCGIGTVLIEALSMGIDIVGCDINPLAVQGARINLAGFGMSPSLVSVGDMRELEGRYDAAIVDLPYNLCSKLSAEERMSLLQGARRLADKAVVVSTEDIEPDLRQAGFEVLDRCEVRKGTFARQIAVCR